MRVTGVESPAHRLDKLDVKFGLGKRVEPGPVISLDPGRGMDREAALRLDAWLLPAADAAVSRCEVPEAAALELPPR